MEATAMRQCLISLARPPARDLALQANTATWTIGDPSEIPCLGVRTEKARPAVVHSTTLAPAVDQWLPAKMAKGSRTNPDILPAVGTDGRGAVPCPETTPSAESKDYQQRLRRR